MFKSGFRLVTLCMVTLSSLILMMWIGSYFIVVPVIRIYHVDCKTISEQVIEPEYLILTGFVHMSCFCGSNNGTTNILDASM